MAHVLKQIHYPSPSYSKNWFWIRSLSGVRPRKTGTCVSVSILYQIENLPTPPALHRFRKYYQTASCLQRPLACRVGQRKWRHLGSWLRCWRWPAGAVAETIAEYTVWLLVVPQNKYAESMPADGIDASHKQEYHSECPNRKDGIMPTCEYPAVIPHRFRKELKH